MATSKPEFWVGHVTMRTAALAKTNEFFKSIGLRLEVDNERFSIWEIRGGTHIALVGDPAYAGGKADFDLMVEDIDQTYGNFQKLGLTISEMKRGDIHDTFYVTEPGGNVIEINSSHVADYDLV